MRQALEAARWRCAQPRDQEKQVATWYCSPLRRGRSCLLRPSDTAIRWKTNAACLPCWRWRILVRPLHSPRASARSAQPDNTRPRRRSPLVISLLRSRVFARPSNRLRPSRLHPKSGPSDRFVSHRGSLQYVWPPPCQQDEPMRPPAQVRVRSVSRRHCPEALRQEDRRRRRGDGIHETALLIVAADLELRGVRHGRARPARHREHAAGRRRCAVRRRAALGRTTFCRSRSVNWKTRGDGAQSP